MPVVPGHVQGPSAFDKSVGAIMGFIMGTVTIFNYGAGPNGVMRTLGKYVAGSGATFGSVSTVPATQSTTTPY
ncbi:subunit of TIM23 translocase complex [Ascosphaera acerosa]|nr:subunit of TIM23 translocase complex [Ascosphaera acerosa]